MVTVLKKPLTIVIILLVASSIGVFFVVTKEEMPTVDFIVAERRTVIQEVSVTGRVKPSDSVDLAFEQKGKVSGVFADVGERVFVGQALVQLERSDLKAELAQKKAKVKIEQAKLDELITGSTVEEIEVQKVKVENAKAALEEAESNLVVKIHDAFTKSDDAVRNKVDQFISNPDGSSPAITFSVTDSELETRIEGGRVAIGGMLAEWLSIVGVLSVESNLIQETATAKRNLNQTKIFLDNVSLAVNALKTSTNFSQTTIDGYRDDVSTARTNINIALTNLAAAEDKVQDTESTLSLEKQQLTLTTAGTRAEQITAQEAKVEEAQASVEQEKVLLSKRTLRAPLGGIVTKQEAQVGEIVSANEIIVSLISAAEFHIEANVPEADIAKIEIGDSAEVTLDAYRSDVVFSVRVVAIDPAETIIEGVATYKTTLQFIEKDTRVRSGMTANIEIRTGLRTDVIAIPARAVITKNGQRIVRLLSETNEVTQVPVQTGLRGSDGSIEIIEGITEGDSVIIFIEE